MRLVVMITCCVSMDPELKRCRKVDTFSKIKSNSFLGISWYRQYIKIIQNIYGRDRKTAGEIMFGCLRDVSPKFERVPRDFCGGHSSLAFRTTNPVFSIVRFPKTSKIVSYSKDSENRNDMCWTTDDLDVLKTKLAMMEEIEHAIRQIESRVDALDDKLWSICDEEIEQEVQIKHLIDEQQEASSDQGFHFDTEILPYPGQRSERRIPSMAGGKSAHVAEMAKKKEHAWDTYRTSFTIVLTKGYLQAVEQLRERMLVQEWDQNLRKIARTNGIARFESYCATQEVSPVRYEVISELYQTFGKDLTCIEDESLRMRCRALIQQEEIKMKKECYDAVTEEARRLAKQFSEAEFIGKVLPDPIEHGLVASVETLVSMFAQNNGP